MRSPSIPDPRPVLAASVATLAIFAAHHVYGAFRYGTPWRHHAALLALAVGAALVAAGRRYRRAPEGRAGRVAAWTLVAMVVLILGVGVGAFEGLYNHVAKDILFLAGAPRELLLRLFPPPRYELPDDLVFEGSGVLQVVAAALATARALGFARALRGAALGRRGPGGQARARLAPGASFPAQTLVTISGEPVRVPDPAQRTHLQLRRFAGCPVCNLHLRSVARRVDELRAAGVREVVVFHSSGAELRSHADGLPFDVVGDPDRRLYAALGVEASPRALLDPRAWWPILRAVLHAAVDLARGRAALPAWRPGGGRFGLPADFLVAQDGRVLACRYGVHVDDQWSVDDVLALAATASAAPGEAISGPSEGSSLRGDDTRPPRQQEDSPSSTSSREVSHA